MKVFLNCFLKKWQKHLITCTLLFSNSLQLDHINYLKLCKFLIMFMTLYMHLLVSTLQSALSAALYVACIASVSMGYKGKELLREKREGGGRGRGRKETLADKPLDFENCPHAHNLRPSVAEVNFEPKQTSTCQNMSETKSA